MARNTPVIRPDQREEWAIREARARSGLERAAFLDGACAGDPALRARLERRLAVQQAAADQSAGVGMDISDGGKTTQIGAGADDAEGAVIGRYKLLEQLGEGGFGVVWLAEQKEPVRRKVALKIIKLGMDSKVVVARFEAERQALALMDHPNIAKVLDAGTTEQGRPYFVMELVRGIRITDYCDQANLSTRDRLDLFIKVCQAIQHSHQKGVIHRDLKPSNVLVTLHDGVPVPKVIDFGIAKATQGVLTDKTIHTQFQQFLGTPAYMSPEQAEMSGLDIDTRSDIYSLGVLLYELLTGSTPFDAKELMSQGIDAMRKTIREQEPPRPSTRLAALGAELLAIAAKRRSADTSRLLHQLKGDLDWIVMKCLEKDRQRRYDTANGLAADLKRYLENEPVTARPPSVGYRLQKAVRRYKVAFAAAAAMAMVLLLGAVISTWQAIKATRAQQGEAEQRRIADVARQDEARHRLRAETQELTARQRAYASDINLAQQAIAINNFGRAQQLLNDQRPRSGQQDLRGWEWRFLWQQCQSDPSFISTLCQETNEIASIAVSADGRWMAVGESRRGGLTIWDLQSRQPAVRLPARNVGQFRAAFSPRENLLAFSSSLASTNSSRPASTNAQSSIRLWNSRTREIAGEIPLQGLCMGLAFADDGEMLVVSTAGPEGQIELWRMSDRKQIASYPAPQTGHFPATPFALAPDMSVAAHATRGDLLRVIDLSSGRQRWAKPAAEEQVLALAMSSDGKILASGAGFTESSIRLWDVAAGKEIHRLEGHRGYVAALLFWPDGKRLASASADQTIRLWDLSDPTNVPPPRVLRGHKREVWRLALLPDHSTLVSGCKDGSVFLWDTTLDEPESTRIVLPEAFRAWRFEAESKSVVTLALNGSVSRWKGARFEEKESLFDLGDAESSLKTLFSPGARLLAVGSERGRISVWGVRQREMLRAWTNGVAPEPVAFLADGKQLVTVDRDDDMYRIWDLTTWKETRSWRGLARFPVSSTPAFPPDDRWCLSFVFEVGSLFKDLNTGIERNLNLNIRQVWDATVSPDGKLLAASSELGFAKLWETATFREAGSLHGALQALHSVAFSPDNSRLAVGSSGIEAIKLWDMVSQKELLALAGQGSRFQRTAFSPDGHVLGSMNMNGSLHLWRAPSWEQIKEEEAKEPPAEADVGQRSVRGPIP